MLQRSDLHGYQERSVGEIYERGDVMGIVPMGGGKTVSTLTAVQELQRDGHVRGGIVLAPKNVASSVWPQEVRQWEHLAGMEIVHVAGTPAQRERLLAKPASLHVVGIDNTQWLTEQMASWPADDPRRDILIVDEISRYKDPSGKRSRELSFVADTFANRVGLTGTPMPNGEQDLYMPARIIARDAVWPEAFLNWRMRYFMPEDPFTQLRWVIRPEWRDKIQDDAAKFSFTVDKSELPATPELRTVTHWVELPDRARTAYREMLRHLITEAGGDVVEAINRAVASGKLDQIAQGFIYRDGQTMEVLHEEKLRKLQDLMDALKGGEQALITYWFAEDLVAIRRLLGEFCPVLGSATSEARTAEYIRMWNAGEIQFLPVHPASAGHGLNLQKSHAGQIIHFCPPWSAELLDQVNARIARQGNTRDTVMSHMILARDTADELKLSRVQGKQAAQEDFIRRVQAMSA